MNLDMVMGFIVGFELYASVRTIIKGSKKNGIIQLILTFLAPIVTCLWCMKKSSFVFGGTDWEFLIQTATVDQMIEPWLILMLYVILIGLTIYNIFEIRERNKLQFIK